jgi:LacI family transcriptional regulator
LVHGSDLDTRGLTFSLMVEMFPAGQLAAMPGLLSAITLTPRSFTNTTPLDDHFLIRAHLPYPVVLVNRTVPRYACVVEDPAAGALAAKVLIQRKSRKLAVLSGRPLTQTIQRWLASFSQGVARELLPPPAEMVADELTEPSACAAISRWFDRGEMIDGLYAVTDGLAVEAYRAIKERGWLIPRDVAVVGVGDYDLSAFFDPPLSTVGVTRGILGKEAGRSLLGQLEQLGFALRKVVIPVYSELRASTGH